MGQDSVLGRWNYGMREARVGVAALWKRCQMGGPGTLFQKTQVDQRGRFQRTRSQPSRARGAQRGAWLLLCNYHGQSAEAAGIWVVPLSAFHSCIKCTGLRSKARP